MSISKKRIEAITKFRQELDQDFIDKGLKQHATLSDIFYATKWTTTASHKQAEDKYTAIRNKMDELVIAALLHDATWANSGWRHMVVLMTDLESFIKTNGNAFLN